MARLRRDLKAPVREADERALEQRARSLVQATFPACDPPHAPSEALHRRVKAEAARLRALGLSPAERVAALESLLRTLGTLERAERRVRSLEGAPWRANQPKGTTQ